MLRTFKKRDLGTVSSLDPSWRSRMGRVDLRRQGFRWLSLRGFCVCSCLVCGEEMRLTVGLTSGGGELRGSSPESEGERLLRKE